MCNALIAPRWGLWVANEILSASDLAERTEILHKAIKVASQCRKLQNFNTSYAIFCGLNFSSISRLRSTWEVRACITTTLSRPN